MRLLVGDDNHAVQVRPPGRLRIIAEQLQCTPEVRALMRLRGFDGVPQGEAAARRNHSHLVRERREYHSLGLFAEQNGETRGSIDPGRLGLPGDFSSIEPDTSTSRPVFPGNGGESLVPFSIATWRASCR